MRAVLIALVAVIACATQSTGKQEYTVTGDECALYNDAQSCDAHSPCMWSELGRPCQVGQPCVSGVCSSPQGSGSGGGSGHGSGSAACACPGGGACYEQIGGPAPSSDPQIQCGGPYACPGNGIPCNPCDSISGQGTCTLDPNVANLCICDNGIR
jgi:hypothetical protein